MSHLSFKPKRKAALNFARLAGLVSLQFQSRTGSQLRREVILHLT